MKKNTLNKFLIALVAFTATLGHSSAQEAAVTTLEANDASSTAVALPGQEHLASPASFTHKYGDFSWETVAELGEDYPAKMFGMNLEAQKKALWALLKKRGPKEFARYYSSYVKQKGHMNLDIKNEEDRDLLFYIIHYMPAELLGKAVQDAIDNAGNVPENEKTNKTRIGKTHNRDEEHDNSGLRECLCGTKPVNTQNLLALSDFNEKGHAFAYIPGDYLNWVDKLAFYITHKAKIKETKTSSGPWGSSATTSVIYKDNPELNTKAELEARTTHLGAALSHVKDLGALLGSTKEAYAFLSKAPNSPKVHYIHNLGYSFENIVYAEHINSREYPHFHHCNENDMKEDCPNITNNYVTVSPFPKELRRYLVRHLKPEQFNNALTLVNDENFTLEVGCDVLAQHFDGLEEQIKGFAVNVCDEEIILAALGIGLDEEDLPVIDESLNNQAALPSGHEAN